MKCYIGIAKTHLKRRASDHVKRKAFIGEERLGLYGREHPPPLLEL